MPVMVTEQYPSRLGSTVQEIKDCLPASSVPVAKTEFTMFGRHIAMPFQGAALD